MNILAIETATESCSVALSLDGEVLERSSLTPRQHAEKLLPWVRELLAEGGASLQDLDALAFSRGPGSFTSLRIGIGVAQGLAWGASIPVVPVSSLRCAAQTAAAAHGVTSAVVALDARMDEVYCGQYQADEHGLMQPAGEERVCAPTALLLDDPAAWSGVGNGFARYPELAALADRLQAIYADCWPQAAAMIPLAEHWIANHALLSAEQAQPVYLRDKVADKPS
jgi:tRNA threonylcarbamoyladenosine biosynthesis protein TsaB